MISIEVGLRSFRGSIAPLPPSQGDDAVHWLIDAVNLCHQSVGDKAGFRVGLKRIKGCLVGFAQSKLGFIVS